jgi:hypothetical protein
MRRVSRLSLKDAELRCLTFELGLIQPRLARFASVRVGENKAKRALVRTRP